MWCSLNFLAKNDIKSSEYAEPAKHGKQNFTRKEYLSDFLHDFEALSLLMMNFYFFVRNEK